MIILHYRDVHTEAGNINKRFDQNLLDYIKYVLQEHHMTGMKQKECMEVLLNQQRNKQTSLPELSLNV